MVIKNCERCKKEFKIYPSMIKKGRGKFCSISCYQVLFIHKCLACNAPFRVQPCKIRIGKGKFCSVKCYKPFKYKWLKGHQSFNQRLTNEKNHNWKGNKVGYWGLHDWVKRSLGKPTTCEHCGKTGLTGMKIHWANRSQEYKRDLLDWIRLCVSCHKNYDNAFHKSKLVVKS